MGHILFIFDPVVVDWIHPQVLPGKDLPYHVLGLGENLAESGIVLTKLVQDIIVYRAVDSEDLLMLYCFRVDEVTGSEVSLRSDVSWPRATSQFNLLCSRM